MRDSFLNGFELHLDDDADTVALELFWGYVSGGSPLLSAFEWILMLHHLEKLGRDANLHFDAGTVCNDGTLTDCSLGIPTAEQDKAPLDGSSSSIVSLLDSNAFPVFQDDVVDRLERADIDPRAFDAVGSDNGIGHAFATIRSNSPSHESADHDLDALNHASSTQHDRACAAHQHSVFIDCEISGLNDLLEAAQPEALGPHSAAEFLEDSPCLRGRESTRGVAAAAAILKDHFVAEHEAGQVNAEIREGDMDLPLVMKEPVAPSAQTGGSGSGGAAVVAAGALAASAFSCALQMGSAAPSGSVMNSPESHSPDDVSSRLDLVTMFTLAQVIHKLCAYPVSFFC